MATAAASDPIPGGFESWEDLYQVQDELDRVADLIVGISNELGTQSGYGSIEVSPENRKLSLYWKGNVPTEVQDTLDGIREDLTFETFDADFSLSEMQSAKNELIENPQGDGVSIVGAAPLSDASGLIVSVEGDLQKANEMEVIRNSTVPITLESGAAWGKTADRQHDTAPFKAGAMWGWPGTEVCSTGFALESRLFPSNQYVLTAEHCGIQDGSNVWIPGGNQASSSPQGEVVAALHDKDLALIQTPSEASVYSGAYDSSFTNDIIGHRGSYVGDYVCTSGQNSGTHCTLKVFRTNYSQPGDHPANLVAAKSLSGRTAVAKGDSGGPVYSGSVSGFDAYARGIIVENGYTSVACDDTVPDDLPDRDCYDVVGYQPMNNIFETWPNLTLMTREP
jgi:hypothetical protein